MNETVKFNDGNMNNEMQIISAQNTGVHGGSSSSTIILPLQLNKVGTDIWRNMHELEDGLRETLTTFTVGKEFTWKRIIDDDSTNDSNSKRINLSKAFEKTSNLQSFYRSFTPEVAETLYRSTNTIIHFIAQCGNSTDIDEKVLGIARCENGLKILPCSEKNEILFGIRKIRLAATIFGTCLMTIEFYRNSTNDEKNKISNDDYWDIESIGNSLGVKSNKKLRVVYTTKCHVYMSSLVWGENIHEYMMEYGKTSIRQEAPFCEEKMESDIERFFGITLECFWIGILQKTVAMYISSRVGSKKTSKRDFNSVYEAYVTFDNQFNFLEVSFNPEIQQEYEAIKVSMNIEETVEKLIRQIDALHSIYLNKQDEKRNIILAFITVLSLVTGCMQVTESFGPNPSIAANIIVGAVSLVIGLVLFFFFVK